MLLALTMKSILWVLLLNWHCMLSSWLTPLAAGRTFDSDLKGGITVSVNVSKRIPDPTAIYIALNGRDHFFTHSDSLFSSLTGVASSSSFAVVFPSCLFASPSTLSFLASLAGAV